MPVCGRLGHEKSVSSFNTSGFKILQFTRCPRCTRAARGVVSDNTLTIKDIDKAPSRHVLLYVACLLGFHPAEAACCVASSKRHFLQRMYGEAGYPCSSTTVEPAPPSATKSWVPLTGTMRVVNPSRNQRALAWE